MTHLLATVLQWIARKLGLLLLIIGVLLVGSWLKAEWDEIAAASRELEQQEMLLAGLHSDLQSLDTAIGADAEAWRKQAALATQIMASRLKVLDDRIAAVEPKWQQALESFANLDRQAQAATAAAARARRELDIREKDFWPWDAVLFPQELIQLELARKKYAALSQVARTWEGARDRVAPIIARSPMKSLYDQKNLLLDEIDDRSRSKSPRHQQLTDAKRRKQQEVAATEQLLESQRQRAAREPGRILVATIKDKLPMALGILVAALLVPVFIKIIFYFGLAPLASRLGPIRILPDDRAPAIAASPPSAVSVAVDIAPGQELLLQPGFLQSSSQPARKKTQWFLNARLPFSSIASGMYALTRIRPEGDASTHVVVSSQHDAFGEVGLIDVPDGAAVVLQPRSLAAIVKPDGAPVRISRHWRLGSLHAWLTLQLRYLVFHGPCQLILKGCRGVRSEEPRPGQPRLINQAATLGFSANLEYRTIRCETFVPYLRGQEDLFNDQFSGGPGRFVYEEMPAGGRRSGVTGRGLEGFADAVLKVFGI